MRKNFGLFRLDSKTYCKIWVNPIFKFGIIILLIFISRPLSGAQINIESNYLEYDEDNKYILALDSVTVTWQNRVINANKIEFWVEKEFLIAQGNVALAENNNVVYGDKVVYDYKTSTGIITPASGNFDRWFFKSEKFIRTGEKSYNAEKLMTTTCDLPKPHYTIRGRRAKILLDDKIVVYHPLFYVGNVPIFYLPKFWQSMTAPKYSIEVEPGYNDIDGFFAKTTIGYPLSKKSYGKLYIDYFAKRGWGEGLEYNYTDPLLRGTIYGYRMKENTTQNEYWNLRASHWQKINNLWTSRSDINYENNTTYNNFYFLDNWQLTKKTIYSNVTFTRQSSRSTFQINAGRRDTFNSQNGLFEPETVTFPYLQYNLYSIFRKFSWSNSLSSSFQNQYDNVSKEYLKKADIYINVRKGYSFFRRKFTFTPEFALGETWSELFSNTDSSYSNNFVTRYYTKYNLKYYLSRSVSWDVGYNYTLRSAINSLTPDYDAVDYGEDTNRAYFQNSYYYRRFKMVNSTGYDFREDRTIIINDWREKLLPLANEIYWTPSSSTNIYFKEESNLDTFNLKSIQTMLSMGQLDKKYISFWVSYNSIVPDEMSYSTSLGFWPSLKWKIDYRINAKTLNKFNEFRANDQELRIYRDLHCWELRLTFKRRFNIIDNTNADAVYFQLNLKTSSANKNKIYNKKHEQEFYPWRQ